WTLILKDASSNILHTANFRSILASDKALAIGAANALHAPVPWYAPDVIGTNAESIGSGTTNSGVNVRCYVQGGKNSIQHYGLVFGLDILISAGTPPTSFDSMKFFTVDPNTLITRGMSDDFSKQQPNPSWGSGQTFKRVYFAKPVA